MNKMKIDLYNAKGEKSDSYALPTQFEESLRKDLIKKAVLVIESNNRQSYGAKPEAGKQVSAKLSRRRHDYRGSYGLGISRVPRKILSRRGTRMNWVGAFAPGTVGGRRAHPPKSSKNWSLKINVKENRFAIRSALSASFNKSVVSARGHIVPETYPFGFSADVENIAKTNDVFELLKKLGFEKELARASNRSTRAGKGKMRSRPYKTKKSILLVVSKPCALTKAAGKMPGVDVVEVKKLNAKSLAPGTLAGRPVLMTQAALQEMEKSKLFLK